jgi:hypothetical protein
MIKIRAQVGAALCPGPIDRGVWGIGAPVMANCEGRGMQAKPRPYYRLLLGSLRLMLQPGYVLCQRLNQEGEVHLTFNTGRFRARDEGVYAV